MQTVIRIKRKLSSSSALTSSHTKRNHGNELIMGNQSHLNAATRRRVEQWRGNRKEWYHPGQVSNTGFWYN
jgi:hypothetical protein